ncbi:unnamed protein product [Adineta steineri]|uniref:Uncharacterized protein n=1 Tax=Adineta steineri TaxID=433720 RepID=A0A819EWZ5_9BILA|nr:unnamed protein product [Adineta steineri]CAF3857225.1 unnamed protein product [Adineta steineri]
MSHLIHNPTIEWLLVLDGDTFVVNATKSLESFIPKDPQIHVVHYERIWFGEIAAGIYLIRNHPWSILYLSKWIETFRKLSKAEYHHSDNGILHLHFLDMVGKLDNHTYQTCSMLYNQATTYLRYLKYVGCVKCAIGGQRIFPHVILLRRGHSFVRDIIKRDPTDYIWRGNKDYRWGGDKIHLLDIMIHGYKANISFYLSEPVNTTSCINNPKWTPKIRPSLFVSDLRLAKIRMRQWDELVAKTFPQTVPYPDIADCWPNCTPEITGAKLKLYLPLLCNYSRFP